MALGWLVLAPIMLPWLGALAVWLMRNRRQQAQPWLAVGFAVAATLATLALLPSATAKAAVRINVGGVFGLFTLVPDGLALFLTTIATVVGSLTLLFSTAYMRDESEPGRYYALVLLFIGSMAGLVLSGSLLFLFLFWEMTAFCSYALIAYHNDDPKAVAGGIKALIITQVGGVGLLLASLLAYASLGDYQIATLLTGAPALPAGILGAIAFACLLAAAAKSAQIPLHIWLPDAMAAPTPVSALIHAATMVNAGVYLLARLFPAFAAVPGWQTAVITLGLLSTLLAGTMAVVATDLKRVLAYSTISQLGFMVYAIGTGALFAGEFHLLSHAVFKALLFLAAGAIIHALGTRDMRQMGGLWRQMPFVAVVFIMGAAALMGLPPFNGFWSKELLLAGGMAQGPFWAYLGMLLGTGITALYTARMVWYVCFGQPATGKAAHTTPVAMRLALAPLALATLATWLVAGRFAAWLAATASPTLPAHRPEFLSTTELVTHLLFDVATIVTLVVVALGVTLWWWRGRLAWATGRLGGLQHAAAQGFGFEWLARRPAQLIQAAAAALQQTQSGQLNWNVAGMVIGLIIVLAIVAGGIS